MSEVEPTMRAYQLTASGPDFASGLAGLKFATVETPKPGPGEVLIRQRAVGLNYVDLLYLSGVYKPSKLPLIPGMDSAGEIAELGEGVRGFAVGDRVVPHMLPDFISGPMPPFETLRARGLRMPGGLSEYAVVPANSLAAMADHLSFEEAATLPTAATTSWNAIREGRAAPGTTALVLGTGGVSLFALQFAKAWGARVIITSSSEEKLARAHALGADDTVNYVRTPDWEREVLALTDGLGVDLVVETAGASTFDRSVRATAREGKIIVAGWRSGTEVSLPINRIQQYRLRIEGVMVGPVVDFQAMMRTVAAARINPVIARVFGFADAAEAYQEMSRGDVFGKIVISI